MKSLGEVPANISSCEVLQVIGENIILADKDYNVVWLNPAAVNLLSGLVDDYGLENVEQFVGLNMSFFHSRPAYQQAIMERLENSHRSRIIIKDKIVTDIVINPIKNEQNAILGYVVLLLDVTTKAQEEERKEKLINELSVPLLHIWDNAIAVPLAGPMNVERFDYILASLLDKCKANEALYAAIDLSGVTEWHEEIANQIDRMINGLSLMGTSCIIVGIKPELAKRLGSYAYEVPIFSTMKAAIKFIISR
ncbi:STAS domain-containing protein [Sediminibacillus albus]|uniref:Anti-anti-sigma regulatory factor (Antagonist of anti-sigma factor) n=1 Tax=Sediminibacillus albus TaxID=407036 RepID=A0A1G8VVR7_9BACI|nr:STAS domain-containing protein [Sediminibacillus albus]SDJ69330.1 Anti-anti-sigma regulatory factor (antagonist of anti-sigma factor) [Sediminibacillus albus]